MSSQRPATGTARIYENTAKAQVSERTKQILHYRNTASGVPIKIMTFGLLSLTIGFAYDLWHRKRFPHQHGVSVIEYVKEKTRS